jgi:OPA family glycerol-3-phosphate transporter-like MFS transporter 1/2
MAPSVPPGIQALINARGGRNYSFQYYRISVLAITFLVYTFYHASRKPASIVKSILKGDESNDGWEPFNGPDGNSLLGSIDVSFLAAYAIGMFFSGHLGDTLDLRIFLTWGMIGSGLLTCLFGMGYFWDVHDLTFYYRCVCAHWKETRLTKSHLQSDVNTVPPSVFACESVPSCL